MYFSRKDFYIPFAMLSPRFLVTVSSLFEIRKMDMEKNIDLHVKIWWAGNVNTELHLLSQTINFHAVSSNQT